MIADREIGRFSSASTSVHPVNLLWIRALAGLVVVESLNGSGCGAVVNMEAHFVAG